MAKPNNCLFSERLSKCFVLPCRKAKHMQKSFVHGEIFHPKDEKPDQNTFGLSKHTRIRAAEWCQNNLQVKL
jgi:hypothetical protein